MINKKIKFELEDKMRIDSFLKKELMDFSRQKIQNLIKSNNIKVNNITINKSSFKLNNGDWIEIDINENESIKINKLEPWNKLDLLNILFENDDYLIIDKPSGLVVHPGNSHPNKTLSNILIYKYHNLPNSHTNRPGIVHRLDKNTSGIMIIAKNEKFYNYIQKQFEEGKIEKEYRLITDGLYENPKGIINVPIGRNVNNRKLMEATSQNSKEAKSIYEVLNIYDKYQYVNFKILTGRTHQIRVHSKYIKAPILNDPEYNGKNIFDKDFGQYLHAFKISFKNSKGDKVTYVSDLPKNFKYKLKELKLIN